MNSKCRILVFGVGVIVFLVNRHVKYKTTVVKFACSKAKVVLFSVSSVTCVCLYTVFSENQSNIRIILHFKIFCAALRSASTV